ncbi:MAG: DUF1194 domain-containing protein, partial [Pseudomonadota bacterium]
GGPGAFMISVSDPTRFGQAIQRKLLLEIADRRKPLQPRAPPLVQKAQFRLKGGRPSFDCLIGEKRWQQYQLEQW